jgi:GT2 family glycosyltransferase
LDEANGAEDWALLEEGGFDETEAPEVSIVIPVHGQIELTQRCLRSLRSARGTISFEVIVVNDGSNDGSEQCLVDIPNLRLMTVRESRGFVHACNRGATEARGRYLVFLNNDTVVTDHWLDRLSRIFETFPSAGMVGAQLLHPDGRLQEAGGIVWNDGSATNYGRGRHPDAPEVSYTRSVDYCSGACLMIPRQLFEEVGMFDEMFAPAYYEDVDLAFRVREVGRRTYVQPKARVYHHEGGTSGTDLSKGAKRFQETNRKKFERRWKRVIRHHGRPSEVLRARDRYCAKRVLIIDHRTPTPDQDAGSARLEAVLDGLSALDAKITLLPADLTAVSPYQEDLQGNGVELLYAPFVRSVSGYLKTHGQIYDAVILSRFPIAERYLDRVRRWCPQARVVLDTVDLHFLREERGARVKGDDRAANRARATKRKELYVASRCDVTLVASPAERDLLATEAPSLDVRLLPTQYVPGSGGPGFERRRDLLFVGGFEHPPNVDAVLWFVESIFPAVLETLPDVRFLVVGSKPPPEILKLATSRIEVIGHVAELTPYLEGCRVAVAPLRYGAGLKGKVHQSLAQGLPCVTTTIGAEGLSLTSGENVLIADDEDGFAGAVTKLYGDPDLWKQLAGGGLDHVRERFGSERLTEVLTGLLQSVSRDR